MLNGQSLIGFRMNDVASKNSVGKLNLLYKAPSVGRPIERIVTYISGSAGAGGNCCHNVFMFRWWDKFASGATFGMALILKNCVDYSGINVSSSYMVMIHRRGKLLHNKWVYNVLQVDYAHSWKQTLIAIFHLNLQTTIHSTFSRAYHPIYIITIINNFSIDIHIIIQKHFTCMYIYLLQTL